MKKVKVYVVVCTYQINGIVEDIELSKMLERLKIKPTDIWYGTEYNVKEVVQWNVDRGYKVNYRVKDRLIFENPLPFGTSFDRKTIYQLADHMNTLHDRMIFDMTDYEAEIRLRQYGNDYTNQCKIKGE